MPDVTRPDLSVVLPAYRTAAMVHELWQRLTRTLERDALSFELIFVDDACPEGSGRIIATICACDPRVILLSNDRNLGQRAAVRNGLAAARGDLVVIMDADLQDEPEHIPALLTALRRGGCEAVFAGRRGAYQSASRMWTSRAFKTLMARLVGVPSDAGSFVAMTRVMADAVLALPAARPHMLVLIGATGLPLRSIPVPRAPRRSGVSAYSEWSRLRFAIASAWMALALRWGRWQGWPENSGDRSWCSSRGPVGYPACDAAAILGVRLPEQPLEHVRRQHAAAEQRFEDRVVQRLHRAVLVLRRIAPGIGESAREQQIRELRHELVHVELVKERRGVFRVFVTHYLSARALASAPPASEVSGPSREAAIPASVSERP